MSLRFYRLALVASLVLNVVMIAGVWYYFSVENVIDFVNFAVGLFH